MNAPRTATSLWLVLALVLAGCLATPSRPLAAPHASPDARPADLTGFVFDEEERPLAGATVRVAELGREARTDATGAYDLTGLAAGRWLTAVRAPGHALVEEAIDLPPGSEVRQDFRLPVLPAPVAHVEHFSFRGSYDCGSEVLILAGDCLVLYENATGQPDPVTQDAYAFRLPIHAAWQTIHVALAWQSGAENQLDGMRLLVEHGNASKTGHGIQVARADGSDNPLEILIARGQAHPTADKYAGTGTAARVPDDGEELQVRVQPRGKHTDVFGQVCDPRTGGCFLGVGVGFDLNFDIEATVAYEPRPAET